MPRDCRGHRRPSELAALRFTIRLTEPRLLALCALLLGCVLYLGFQNWLRTAKADHGVDASFVGADPFQLPATLAPPGRPSLYFVFALDACPYCLDEINVINSLYDTYGKSVTILGIALTNNKPALDAFRAQWNVRFALQMDTDQWAALHLKNPCKIATDSTGRVAYYAGPFPDPPSHSATFAHLNAVLANLAANPHH